MFKHIIEKEKALVGLIFANGSLEGVHRFIIRFQPEINTLVSVVQIVVGVLTVIHIIKKWRQSRKAKNEVPTPDSP